MTAAAFGTQPLSDAPPADKAAALRMYWSGLAILPLLAAVLAYAWIVRTPGAPYLVIMMIWLTIIVSGYQLLRSIGRYDLARLFQWPHSVGSSILFTAFSVQLSAVAVLIVIDGLLDEMRHQQASRHSLRQAGAITIATLAVVVLINALSFFGWHVLPPLLSTYEIIALNVALIIPYCIDILQRLWRFQNQIASAVSHLEESNEALDAAQQELQRRLHERTQLLEASRAVSSKMDLQPLLMQILTQLNTVIEYGRATVMLLRGDDIVEICTNGTLDRYNDRLSAYMNDPHHLATIKQMLHPVLLADLSQIFPGTTGSLMAVPLVVRGKFIGLVSVRRSHGNFFTDRDADFCMAFANQVAGMIDSVQLQEAAASAMVIAERHRLARELHDSISQSLFGIVLGTRTAQEQLASAPDAARAALDYSVSLASAALADMRALIFTLRPETLERKGLLAALQAQIDLLQPHHAARIHLDAPDGEPAASLDVKESLYRIAVEALQNALRHSGGSSVHICIAASPTLQLAVVDDGHGFDPNAAHDGHLGLQSMRERAATLDAAFYIDSAPGRGTRISVTCTRSPGERHA